MKGAKQIGFTILSLTVSLIAVLIPLLFMGDVVGRLFREFAVTLSVTILVSAAVSLTLTPMMCAKLLRHRPASSQSRFERGAERAFERVQAFYKRTLEKVLEHQPATLAVAVATLVVTVALYVFIPKGFFPVQDTGVLLGISEAEQSVSFSTMAERQQALARVILADPAVESLSSFIGVDGTNATLNSGRIQINLKPLGERDVRVRALIRRLQPKLAAVPGITLYMQPAQELTVEDRVSRTQYQYSLEHPEARVLEEWAPKLIERLQKVPALADVASDQQNRGLRVTLVLDRATMSRLGLTPQMVDDALYDAFGQRQISTMFTQLNQYRVVLEADPGFQKTPEDLAHVYVRGASGSVVPLSAFTRIEQSRAPLAINHQGQFPVVTLSFNLAPGVSLGEAVRAIDRAKAEVGMPAGIQAGFQGTARAFRASLVNTPLLILAAIVTVYILLGVLYESYIHPVTILSTLPSAGVGALLSLMICRMDFNVIALIGIILLIGIVEKNAIMMIDFALDAERLEGKPPREAITQACLLRLRPILMTTFAALLAGIPLAVGGGTGAELRRPLGSRDRGRPHLLAGPDALHDARDLPRLRPPGAPRRPQAGAPRHPRSSTGLLGGPVSVSTAFIRRPIATTLLTVAVALAGGDRVLLPPGLLAAAGGVPDDPGLRGTAGREPRDHGFLGRHAARAPVRPHRRRHGDDLDELPRLDVDHRCSST